MTTLADKAETASAALSNDEVLRYSRHLIMPEVGMEGQLKLKQAKVLCIGAGGLGSPLALYLAAAGVGMLGIVDFDVVDMTNLQRQVIHGTADVGRKKLDSAADRIAAINPYVDVRKFETRLTSANALQLFRDFDIIVDGTDNFPTRYLVNDACVLSGKPNVYGSIFRGPGERVRHAKWSLLPLPLSRAAAARTGSLVRRRRCVGNSARAGWGHPGDRNHQANPGFGRAAHRTPASGGRARHALSRTEAAQGPRLSYLRRPSNSYATD